MRELSQETRRVLVSLRDRHEALAQLDKTAAGEMYDSGDDGGAYDGSRAVHAAYAAALREVLGE